MEVSIQKKENGLDALMTVNINNADYQAEVEKIVNDYRKKVTLPGFRPGKVPVGVVRKMVEKDAKRDAVDKILQSSVDTYIKENDLKMVLSPISAFVAEDIDWNGTEFAFNFDIGIRPDFKLDVVALNRLTKYKVEASDEDINKELEAARQRLASVDDVESFTEADNVYVVIHLHERDDEGNEMEGGAHKIKRYNYNELPEKLRPILIGQQKGFKTVIDVTDIFTSDELAATFDLDENGVRDLNAEFDMDIRNVYQMNLPEVNTDFFQKVLNTEDIHDEDSFKDELAKGISIYFEQQSNNMLAADIKTALMENTALPLPNEFVAKYMLLTYEVKSAEEIEDYDKKLEAFEKDLKWMLIADEIAQEQGFEIGEDDVMSYTTAMLHNEFMNMGYPDLGEEFLRKYAVDYLKRDNNFTRTSLALRDGKIFDFLISQMNPQIKSIDSKKFEEIANKN